MQTDFEHEMDGRISLICEAIVNPKNQRNELEEDSLKLRRPLSL